VHQKAGFFAAFGNAKQAGEGGGVWARVQGAGMGEKGDRAPSCTHTSERGTLSSKIKRSCPDIRCSFGARQARGPGESAGEDGRILA